MQTRSDTERGNTAPLWLSSYSGRMHIHWKVTTQLFRYYETKKNLLSTPSSTKGHSTKSNFLSNSQLTEEAENKHHTHMILKAKQILVEEVLKWHQVCIVWVVFLISFAPYSLFRIWWLEPKIPALKNDLTKWCRFERLHCFISGVVLALKKKKAKSCLRSFWICKPWAKKHLIGSRRSIRAPLQLN